MTVPSTTRRAGPFTGTGVLVAYPFTFKVFAKQDLAVTIADANGLETDLVLDSTFTVTLNVDQEATPGGTVNYAAGGVATALPLGYTLVVTGDGLEFEQTADLPQGGNFSPVVIENALDRAVMLSQRLWDGVRRSMRLPDTASDSVSTVLPVPTANNFIGWDSNATALRNVDPNTLATVVAFAAWQSQAFSGDGVTTQFTLSSDPGNVNNLDVVVGAVPQRNNVDFTLSGTTLTFDAAPANGLSIFCRWGQALPEGTSTLQTRLASTASVADGDALMGVKWVGPDSAAPSAATTAHQMNEDAATVMNVITDSLKAAIRALTSTTNLASMLQPYLQYCYDKSVEVKWPAGQYTFEPIAINVNGGRLDLGMKWTGAGKNVTKLKRSGASTSPLISIQQTTPASTSTSIQLMMRDVSILGSGGTGTGLKLSGTAAGWIENCTFDGWDYGVDMQSTLIFWFNKNTISANNTGVRVQRRSTDSFCNLLVFRDNQINSNARFGLDIDACDSMNIHGNQFEANGVAQSTATVTVTSASPGVVTWNSHGLVANDPVIFTNSGGALPTGITADYIYYVSATGLTTNTFQFSATVGGSSVNTSSTGTGTHTASSPKTGAIVVRKACVDELGAVVMNITEGNRFEGNRGADIRTEYMSTAFGLYVNINNNLMAGTSDGPMIAIGFARKVAVKGCVAPVGTSTWNINTDQLLLENSKVINLRRPGGANTDTIVINSGYGGTDYVSGETGSYTATLTGCTTSPTATITYTVQGKEVTLNIAPVTATSNATTATLTGMPAASSTVPNLYPSVKRNLIGCCTDNSAEKISPISVEATGVITLNNAFAAFTASGTKGVGTGFTVKYER